MATQLPLLEPDWPALPHVRAAMTTRQGGVSVKPYDRLNLGAHVGDDPAHVAENRRRVRESLALPAEPNWLQQVHGVTVCDLDAQAHFASQADAAITRRPGRICAIQVADCMPVLFTALDASAIGAAHAGWRGLAGGVLEATVHAMGTEPAQLLAWLGPAISARHFEVGDDVREIFVARSPDSASAFVRNPRQRWQCDLYALARQRLAALGVTKVFGGLAQSSAEPDEVQERCCTYANAERFFSYRRDGQCGRMAALIWIES